MISPLLEVVDDLVAGLPNAADRTVLFEVPAFESIPDLVIVQLNDAAVEQRRSAGITPVPDLSSVRALAGLSAGIVDLDALANRTGVTRAHLRRKVIPTLGAAGWLTDPTGRTNGLQLSVPFKPVLTWVVTVEAKRTKWREAYAQARRQQRVADKAFVALDAGSANPARSWSSEFAAQGVGLVTVDARTDSARVEQRPRRGPRPDFDARLHLGERVVEMRSAGVSIGKTFPVFGQILPMRVGIG